MPLPRSRDAPSMLLEWGVMDSPLDRLKIALADAIQSRRSRWLVPLVSTCITMGNPSIVVELTGAELVTGEARTTLGHLNGSRDRQGQRGTFASRRTLEYVVRATERQAAFGITILSEKGGRTRRDILLGMR